MRQTYILGGYTKRDNDGIYSIVFKSTEGTFTDKQLIQNLNAATFVTMSKAKDLLFSIHKEDDRGGIVAFRKDSATNSWKEIDRLFPSDATGCHLSFREASQTLYVSNYGLGQIDVYQLIENKLTHIQVIKHEGSSVHPNQDASHVHYAGFNDHQTLLYVCDLGTDYVSTYKIADDGTISLSSDIKLPAGTGPRHLISHPNEPYIYVLGELANTTTIMSVDGEGKMAIVETVANIPDEFVEQSAGAAIRISKDGKFLYTSTRFHNVITVFEVSEHGDQLHKIQEIDSNGEIPRDFTLDRHEKYILVPHQDSDYISVFQRDQQTGKLTFDNNETYAPECVCIALV